MIWVIVLYIVTIFAVIIFGKAGYFDNLSDNGGFFDIDSTFDDTGLFSLYGLLWPILLLMAIVSIPFFIVGKIGDKLREKRKMKMWEKWEKEIEAEKK